MHPANNNKYCTNPEDIIIINTLNESVPQPFNLVTTTPAPQTTPGIIIPPTSTSTTTTTPPVLP